MEPTLGILTALGVFVGIPTVVGFAVAGAYILSDYQARRGRLPYRELVCSIDADCPPGYACIGGRCVPEPVR